MKPPPSRARPPIRPRLCLQARPDWTLYGHNETLQAEMGDCIRPGEVVALAGTSGGESKTGLYFEIRKDGQPVDPAGWVGTR